MSGEDMGASADADRAAGPVDPSPAVSAKGGIPSAWLPIETAPRDGSKIIITRADPTGKNPAKLAWWGNSEPRGWRWRAMKVVRYEPTHWMPLPPAPRKLP